MTKLHNKESADEYAAIIMQIDSRTRVIRCRYDLQWIMQIRTSPDLNKGYGIGCSYHTSRDSLLEACRKRGLQSDTTAEAVLNALPDHVSQLAKK